MELGWGALALLCLAAAIGWFWQDSLAARERANSAAMEACQRLSLQFLDGTVAFARLAFARRAGGRFAFRRTYVFDYTANSIERRQGFVVLIGRRVESVGYAPGEEQRAAPQALIDVSPIDGSRTDKQAPTRAISAPPQSPAPSESATVLDLADWRARHRGSQQPPQSRRADGQDNQPG
jgi:hypothetical protein